MSEKLKLGNQLCFPLYTLAKEVIKQYRPILMDLDLTYSQYLVMMVLWEEGEKNVSEIGNILNLDSGTLTPLLKRLEQKNIISRNRKIEDERVVTVTLTEVGVEMKVAAQCIPDKILEALNIDKEDLMELNKIVNKINIQLKK